MSKYYSIAIDGPSGAGKSTIAKAAAKALGFVYLDTGAIYRTVAWHITMMGIGPKDTDHVPMLLDDANIKIDFREDGQHMILNGKDIAGGDPYPGDLRLRLQGGGTQLRSGLPVGSPAGSR